MKFPGWFPQSRGGIPIRLYTHRFKDTLEKKTYKQWHYIPSVLTILKDLIFISSKSCVTFFNFFFSRSLKILGRLHISRFLVENFVCLEIFILMNRMTCLLRLSKPFVVGTHVLRLRTDILDKASISLLIERKHA